MKVELGTVSHGTMRLRDLIPAFIAELEFYGVESDALAEIKARAESEDTRKYYGSETADLDLEDLFDMLDDIAPEGAYFGAHPGDGADYGFWPCEDES